MMPFITTCRFFSSSVPGVAVINLPVKCFIKLVNFDFSLRIIRETFLSLFSFGIVVYFVLFLFRCHFLSLV